MADQIVLTAKDAIRRHMQWKITIQLAITMREPLSADHVQQIENFRRCAIGAWLESSATLPIRSCAEYDELKRRHIRFHDEMVSIARLLHAGRFEEATVATQPGSAFDLASRALAAAITVCNRILPIAAPLPAGTVFLPPLISPK